MTSFLIPFIAEQDDYLVMWMGSRNQRVIDVPASLLVGGICVIDWSSPEVIIESNGNLLMPVGLTQDFGDVGEVKPTRMCGETNE